MKNIIKKISGILGGKGKFIQFLTILILLSVSSYSQPSISSPDEALKKLKQGNERWASGTAIQPNQNQERRTLTSTKGQHPFATVIACSDSRVPVEQIFDVGIGDIFTIKVAGNVCDIDEAGSIEYGVDHLGTPVFVVLGHTDCGACTAVARGDIVHGNIPALVDNIIPAADKAKSVHGNAFSTQLLNATIENNVWQAIEDLLKISPETAELVRTGKLKIVGAVYNLGTGKVKWLGEHPQQNSLLQHSSSESSHSSSSGRTAKKREKSSEVVMASTLSHSGSDESGFGGITILVIIIIIFIGLVFFLLINKSTSLKLNIRGRILSLALSVLFLLIMVGGFSYYYMSKIGGEITSIAEEDLPLIKKISQIEAHQFEQAVILERILKLFHQSQYENESHIEELEKEFEELSEKVDIEIVEGEELCEEVILHEKNKSVVEEFKYVLASFKKIEQEHADFEEESYEMFKNLNAGKMDLVEEQEEVIEEEADQLNAHLASLLENVEAFTDASAKTAEADEADAIIIIIISIIVAVLISLVIALMIAGEISKAMIRMTVVSNEIANGDLTSNIDIVRSDEIGRLADNFKTMIAKLREVVRGVISGSDNIASASQQMSANSEQVSEGASEQASSAEEVSSSMEQMSSNIQQNTDNAQQTEKIAQKAAEDITEGSNNVNITVDSMKKIADKVSIIGDIAFQTNILALNAAVEAARAGEHGRGFAVVAAEVRKLAERSQVAAGEIDELSKSSVDVAEKSGKLLEEIVPDIQKTSKLVQEITAASLEQNSGAEQINNAIQQLNQVTQENASASEEMATGSEELASQAEQLREMIAFFKIDDHQTKKVDRVAPEQKKQIVKAAPEKKRVAKAAAVHTQTAKPEGKTIVNEPDKSKGVKLTMDSGDAKDKDFEKF